MYDILRMNGMLLETVNLSIEEIKERYGLDNILDILALNTNAYPLDNGDLLMVNNYTTPVFVGQKVSERDNDMYSCRLKLNDIDIFMEFDSKSHPTELNIYKILVNSEGDEYINVVPYSEDDKRRYKINGDRIGRREFESFIINIYNRNQFDGYNEYSRSEFQQVYINNI